MKQNYPWNTLLLTRQNLFRGAIAKTILLDNRFRLVAEAEDAAQAHDVVLDFTLDLFITEIDWQRPEEFELIRVMRKKSPHVRILAVIEEDDPFTFARLAETAVHGCISKNESMELFEEAMVEIASGGTYFPAAYHENIRKLRSDPLAFSKILTSREQEVLWHVATGLTSRTIAARLKIGLRSVETYRYRMMKKLEVKNAAGLVEYALRHGLIRRTG